MKHYRVTILDTTQTGATEDTVGIAVDNPNNYIGQTIEFDLHDGVTSLRTIELVAQGYLFENDWTPGTHNEITIEKLTMFNTWILLS